MDRVQKYTRGKFKSTQKTFLSAALVSTSSYTLIAPIAQRSMYRTIQNLYLVHGSLVERVLESSYFKIHAEKINSHHDRERAGGRAVAVGGVEMRKHYRFCAISPPQSSLSLSPSKAKSNNNRRRRRHLRHRPTYANAFSE